MLFVVCVREGLFRSVENLRSNPFRAQQFLHTVNVDYLYPSKGPSKEYNL